LTSHSEDATVLRDLVKRYLEVCAQPVQAERRRLWRDHNSLRPTRPLFHVRGGNCWDEVPAIRERRVRDDFLRGYERELRKRLFAASLDDDTIYEPWLTVPATHRCWGWGLTGQRMHSAEARGSWKADYPIKEESDIRKLQPPRHEIDEETTAQRVETLRQAVGDLIPVHVDRAPAWRMWTGDLSTELGYLRGIENLMLDMLDRPAWLHELLAFMCDGILRAHEQAEQAGDWSLAEHQNQVMPYARELSDPAPNTYGAKRSELWGYMAAQEYTLISPAMHEEFLLQYQRPILEKFGLTAYGCCEDLTRKIDMLRSLPNLRRIAVTPVADVRKSAEQIGTDYVISWRPNPAQMVCLGFDEALVRKIVHDALDACRGLHMDITLKDVHTVQGQPERLARWCKLIREMVEA